METNRQILPTDPNEQPKLTYFIGVGKVEVEARNKNTGEFEAVVLTPLLRKNGNAREGAIDVDILVGDAYSVAHGGLVVRIKGTDTPGWAFPVGAEAMGFRPIPETSVLYNSVQAA